MPSLVTSIKASRQPVVRAWVGLLGTAVVLHAAHTVLGLGPDGALFDAWLFNAIILGAAGTCVARGVLRRAERPAWLAFGVAMVIFSAAEVTYAVLYGAAPDYHPVSDALWLAFYPASYAALMLLVRSRMREFTASLWLDGLIGAFAVGAIAAALVFQPVLASTEGSVAFVATHLAFPLGDLLLIAFVVGVFGLRGWRPGRDWLLIGAGLMVIAVADSIYAYQAAVGSYAEGTWLDTLWPASAVLLASAAWSRPSSALLRLEGWRTLIVPCVFALSALVLQVYMFVAGAGALAVALTSATITTVILRAALAFRENLRMVGRMRVDSLTDQLTGLGNRRLLLFDLAAELSAATDAAPRVLGLFDLDGFKRYNDTYGHPAGDALLARLAERMADAVGEGGRAYRMGGDEFCALIDGDPGGTAPAIARVAAALSDHGDRFAVTSSYGMVVLPKEAKDPSAALRLADRRMYGHKSRRHHSAVRQSTDVALQALRERELEPVLGGPSGEVAVTAGEVGRRLGLEGEEIDVLVRAAELHDVGKMAIPFPARIIAVCDAFDSMTADRSYRRAMPVSEAVAELRRCAGSQFDPRVVEAFCAQLHSRSLGDSRARPATFR